MDSVATVLMWALALGVIWIVGVLIAGVWRRYERAFVTIMEHEAGLRYEDGKLTGVLGAGRYPTWPRNVEIARVDLREQSVQIANQEILTADHLPVRVSVVVTYRVGDVRAHAKGAAMPLSRLYQIVQVAVRDRVAAHKLDDLMESPNLIADILEVIETPAAELGYALMSVKLMDLTLQGPAKQAYADLWKAQKEGLAALERARGEQAALRALGNAARMLKDNPELMNLRILQAVAGAPGKNPPTLVLGGAPGLAPVSRDAQINEAPSGDA